MAWNDIVKLIELAQNGDRKAYGELVERFQPAVYALALARTRNANEAQELTQEVFIHAMTKIGQLRDPNCFVGWLRQITVRMAINRATRRVPLWGTEPDVLQNAPDNADTPLDEILRAEQREHVWELLEQLKPMDRATLVAFYIHGQSLKEMSQDFETPVGTIKRRLHVARNRLKDQLDNPKKATKRRDERREELAAV